MVVLSEMPVASAIQRQHIGTPGPIPPRPNSSDGDGRLPVIAGAAPAVPETVGDGGMPAPSAGHDMEHEPAALKDTSTPRRRRLGNRPYVRSKSEREKRGTHNPASS